MKKRINNHFKSKRQFSRDLDKQAKTENNCSKNSSLAQNNRSYRYKINKCVSHSIPGKYDPIAF